MRESSEVYWKTKPGREYRHQQELRTNSGSSEYKDQERYILDYLTQLAQCSKRRIRVLDFGCGFGRFAAPVSRIPGVDYFGYDFSLTMTSEVVATGPSEIGRFDVRVAPSLHEAFPDQLFDVVFTVSVLIHNSPEQVTEVLAQISDHLDQAGSLLLIENELASFSCIENFWHGACWVHNYAEILSDLWDIHIRRGLLFRHDIYHISRKVGLARDLTITDGAGEPQVSSLDQIRLLGLDRILWSTQSIVTELSPRAITLGTLHDAEEAPDSGTEPLHEEITGLLREACFVAGTEFSTSLSVSCRNIINAAKQAILRETELQAENSRYRIEVAHLESGAVELRTTIDHLRGCLENTTVDANQWRELSESRLFKAFRKMRRWLDWSLPRDTKRRGAARWLLRQATLVFRSVKSFKNRRTGSQCRHRPPSDLFAESVFAERWKRVESVLGGVVSRISNGFLVERPDLVVALAKCTPNGAPERGCGFEDDRGTVLFSGIPINSLDELKRAYRDKFRGKVHVWGYVILQRNNFELTFRCIDSIRRIIGETLIVVVDNASTDARLVDAERHFGSLDNVVFVHESENVGFARANNRGYQIAKERGCDFIAVINNDTYFQQSEFQRSLEDKFWETLFSVCGPDIIHEGTKHHQNPMQVGKMSLADWHSRIEQTTNYFRRYRFASKSMIAKLPYGSTYPPETDIQDNLILHGAALIFSPVFVSNHDSAFDERTFLYCEEDLLCLNSSVRGDLCIMTPTAQVVHIGGGSTEDRTFRKVLAFQTKNYRKSVRHLTADLTRLASSTSIPKVLHYCWFGGKPKPDSVIKCIESWRAMAPDFEIREWNESNCRLEANYVKQAYEQRKWAFVSDYVRLEAVFNYGGVYLDTDVELLKPVSRLLHNSAFFGFESDDYIQTAFWGAVAGHWLLRNWMAKYENREFITPSGELDMTTNVVVLTDLLRTLGLQPNGKNQLVGDVALLEADVLTVDINNGRCIGRHDFAGTWLDDAFPQDGQERYRNTFRLEHPIRALLSGVRKRIFR